MFRLKSFRIDNNLKQADLQKIFNCAQSVISRIERGRDDMPIKFIRILNETYGKETVSQYMDQNSPISISDNNSTSIAGNGNHHINANATLEKAINEISEQRKLVQKAQEQMDKLLAMMEKMVDNSKTN